MTPISLTLLYLSQILEGFNFPMNIAEPEPVPQGISLNILYAISDCQNINFLWVWLLLMDHVT